MVVGGADIGYFRTHFYGFPSEKGNGRINSGIGVYFHGSREASYRGLQIWREVDCRRFNPIYVLSTSAVIRINNLRRYYGSGG